MLFAVVVQAGGVLSCLLWVVWRRDVGEIDKPKTGDVLKIAAEKLAQPPPPPQTALSWRSTLCSSCSPPPNNCKAKFPMYQEHWPEISDEQLHSAVVALNKLQNSEDALWTEDSPVQLQFSFQFIVDISKKLRPKLIKVPHQIFPEKTAVCLIVRDNIPPTLLQGLKSQYGKVIALAKLQRNYHDNEERRKLCGKFDLFLYDKKINATSLPHAIGKVFFEKKKNPIAITVRSIGGVSNEIERVKGCALYFKNGGVSTALKVARLDFTEDQIIDNVKAVLSKMPSVIDPSAVQSICIKTPDSIALPLYQCATQVPANKKISIFFITSQF